MQIDIPIKGMSYNKILKIFKIGKKWNYLKK
jgi:hypothetical protein